MIDAFQTDARYFVVLEALKSVVRFYEPYHSAQWPPYAVIAKAALDHIQRSPGNEVLR